MYIWHTSISYISTTFSFIAEKYFIVHIHHNLFNYPSMNVSAMSTFWLLWTVLLWKCVYIYLLWGLVFNTFAYILGVELQGHMVILCLTFWVAAKMFFIVNEPFKTSTSNVGFQIFLQPCQHLLFSIVAIFYRHPSRHKGVLHCGFDLHFPSD